MVQNIAPPSSADRIHHPVEVLSQYAHEEWLCDGRIVCYWAAGASRNTYQLLFDRAEQIALDWPTDRPYLAIIDFLTGRAGVTPYAKERGRTLHKIRPDLPTMIAMVMPHSVQASFAQLAMRTFRTPTRAIDVYYSRKEAIAWLKRMGRLE